MELNIHCNLYFKLNSDNETLEEAEERLIKILSENNIDFQFYEKEIQTI